MNEQQLQDAIVDEATLRKWLVYHTYDSRRSASGFPDLVLVKGRLIFAELKVGTNERSVAQIVWGTALEGVVSRALHSIRAAGATRAVPLVSYFEWREDDWLAGRVSAELRR